MLPSQFIVLCILTGLVAVGLLLQGIALLLILGKVRKLSARMNALSADVMKHLVSVTVQLEELLPVIKTRAEKFQAVEQNITAIITLVRERVIKIDAFAEEAADSARLQIARIQDILETTAQKIDETINAVQYAVLAPVNEAQAIVRGIRSALDVLLGRHRPSSRHSHQDEEMFI